MRSASEIDQGILASTGFSKNDMVKFFFNPKK